MQKASIFLGLVTLLAPLGLTPNPSPATQYTVSEIFVGEIAHLYGPFWLANEDGDVFPVVAIEHIAGNVTVLGIEYLIAAYPTSTGWWLTYGAAEDDVVIMEICYWTKGGWKARCKVPCASSNYDKCAKNLAKALAAMQAVWPPDPDRECN